MKYQRESLVPRVRNSESGQTLGLVMVCIMTLLAMGALVIDLGNYYVNVQRLNTATQASALAGANVLSTGNFAQATIAAELYSAASSSDYNFIPTISNPTVSVTDPGCLTTTNVACYSSSQANAIEVTETGTINTIFAKLVGIPTLTITSTAWASAAGGQVGPYNIAMIVDTTPSMSTTDSGSGSDCPAARIVCAMQGYQALLENLDPCSPLANQNCTASGVAPLNVASLWTFPGLTSTSEQPDDWCGSTKPTVQDYKAADNAVYQLTPWTGTGASGDAPWRTSDSVPYLNPSSDLALAMGVSGTLNQQCTNTNVTGSGVWVSTNMDTYYAGVITQAQTALYNELQAPGRGNAQNVMIFVSDGDSNSVHTDAATAKNQCHEAISAAQSAVRNGTWVYSVAYGAEATGCRTDCGLGAPTCNPGDITPCQTMEDIAAGPGGVGVDPTRFFSDYQTSTGTSSCIGRSQSNTALTYIFKEIAGDLTKARLIPLGTQ